MSWVEAFSWKLRFWGRSLGRASYSHTWWRHQMETFSALLAICAGNSPGEFPAQRPVMRSFDAFFDLHRNKWLIHLYTVQYLQYIPIIMCKIHTVLCLIVIWWQSILLIPFRVTSLPLGQSYDCPSVSEVTLKDMGNCSAHWCLYLSQD